MSKSSPNQDEGQAPYQRSGRAEITEEEYNRLQGEYLDRLEALKEAYERDAVDLAARHRLDHDKEHAAFYGDGSPHDDEGDLASAMFDVIARVISDETWLGYIAESLQRIQRYANVKPDGYVYVLEAGPFYKIGRTKDLSSRIKTLSIQLPFPVKCIAAFPCEDTAAAERELHERFSEHRANGEWFMIPDRKPWMNGLTWLKRILYCTTDHCSYLHKIVTDFHNEIPLAVERDPYWHQALTAAFNAVEVEE